MDVIIVLFNNPYVVICLCYFAHLFAKSFCAWLIAKYSEMSNEKAKHITDMMSKDINIKLQ